MTCGSAPPVLDSVLILLATKKANFPARCRVFFLLLTPIAHRKSPSGRISLWMTWGKLPVPSCCHGVFTLKSQSRMNSTSLIEKALQSRAACCKSGSLSSPPKIASTVWRLPLHCTLHTAISGKAVSVNQLWSGELGTAFPPSSPSIQASECEILEDVLLGEIFGSSDSCSSTKAWNLPGWTPSAKLGEKNPSESKWKGTWSPGLAKRNSLDFRGKRQSLWRHERSAAVT